MPRFIFSDTREEILKKRNEWKMKFDARNQVYKGQEQNYNKARWNWQDNVENLIRKQFQSEISKLPDLRIDVDRYWDEEIRIRFDYEPNRNSDRRSLLWSYEVKLTEKGEIEKESNSWSGFNAVTSAQIEDLMNSVNFLKAIVDFDWTPLLKEAQANKPKYRNYVAIRDPNYDPEYKDPGFDKMLREADVEEAIKSGKWIKGAHDWHGNIWYFIVSQTPKFYKVATIKDSNLKGIKPGDQYYDTWVQRLNDPGAFPYYIDKIKKDNLSFANPIELKTPDELLQLASAEN